MQKIIKNNIQRLTNSQRFHGGMHEAGHNKQNRCSIDCDVHFPFTYRSFYPLTFEIAGQKGERFGCVELFLLVNIADICFSHILIMVFVLGTQPARFNEC